MHFNTAHCLSSLPYSHLTSSVRVKTLEFHDEHDLIKLQSPVPIVQWRPHEHSFSHYDTTILVCGGQMDNRTYRWLKYVVHKLNTTICKSTTPLVSDHQASVAALQSTVTDQSIDGPDRRPTLTTTRGWSWLPESVFLFCENGQKVFSFRGLCPILSSHQWLYPGCGGGSPAQTLI